MKMLWSAGMAATALLLSASAFAAVEPAQKMDRPSLTSADCVKCHEKQPADLAALGGRHKTPNCRGCHASHKPSSKRNIPECKQCHEGEPHFALKGCLGCHRDPHTPLQITLTNNITDACLTCHDRQIAQLKEFKSKHSTQACSRCHDEHGKKPACTNCHKPHSTGMTASDCNLCHKAHKPKAVTYAETVPNTMCGACHKRVFDQLSASTAKHSTLQCGFCHKEKHKAMPQCLNCHQPKHPAGIMAKFPRCSECHNIAHDLNNFGSRPVSAPAPALAPAQKGKKT
jgi:predicted CXXCH cytochrome family protein